MKRYGVDSVHSCFLVAGGMLVLLSTSGSYLGTSGVLYKAYLDVYQSSEEEASWPTSVHAGMAFFSGPVAAALSTWLSIRSSSTLCVLLYSVGSCACYFSSNVIYLCFCYGVISGLGDFTVYILTPALITRVFERYQVTAMGFLLLGFPLSILIFPLISNALLERYGLQGTYLLLGAVSMHGLIGSVILLEHENNSSKDSKSSTRANSLQKSNIIKTQNTVGEVDNLQRIPVQTTGLTTVSYTVKNLESTSSQHSESICKVGLCSNSSGLFSGGDQSYDRLMFFMGFLSALTSLAILAEILWIRKLSIQKAKISSVLQDQRVT